MICGYRAACILFVLAGAVWAQDEGDRAFAPKSDPAFGDARVPLREFLRDRHVHSAKVQHFCIAGYQGASDKRAWVHWREGGQIILWRGATNPLGAKTSIARSRRVTDLEKDVVATEADIKSSTYLVTRAWVDRVLADCQERGEKYEIRMQTKQRK